jgi:alanine racemase
VTGRWAWAEVDLGAIEHNVRTLRQLVAPSAVWAVVKADAYGHGAVPVAGAALAAGAEGLGVALTQEGVELRCAGIEAPIIVLSQQPASDAETLVRHRLVPTLYTVEAVEHFAAAVARAGAPPHPVHVKVDTGMHRSGAAPAQMVEVVAAIDRADALRLEGVFTHLAIADVPGDPFTAEQLAAFDEVLAALSTTSTGAADDRPLLVHAANSAGALAHAAARRSFVRIGIAMYGITPGDGVADLVTDLRPAMTLRAKVSFVRRVAAGDRISYGLTHTFARDTTVAVLPIGYADGVPRRLSNVGEVLVGGRRRRIVGVVTMDQLMVDCGDDEVAVGDDAVLLGRQGVESVRPEEWAALTGTIGYEIVCGISARIARRYV